MEVESLEESERYRMGIAKPRKIIEPRTHIAAPAAIWSLSASSRHTRGACAYVEYSTRPENTRKAETIVFTMSAASRYGTNIHRDVGCRDCCGCITTHQNATDVQKKHRCSKLCQFSECNANSNA